MQGNDLLDAIVGMADRPRMDHECTNSAIIRLFVVPFGDGFLSKLTSQLVMVGSYY